MGDWPLIGRDHEVRRLEDKARSGSVVVSGDVGVGKSRLVAHVLARTAQAGARTVLLRATRSTATVPFGPFAPWVPEQLGPGFTDRLQVLRAISRSLLEDGGPVVVGIDDAHLLDEGSAALVLHLVTQRATRVIATVRSNEPCPDAVVALWKEGLAELVELPPLGQADTLSLAARALGDSIDDTARHRLWELTGGAPLYLREVLRAAVDQGVLSHTGDTWSWQGELGGDARLSRLTNDNLHRATEAERRALELVAIGEPLPLALVTELGCSAELEDAQRRSLVTVDGDDAQPTIRMAHPLYGEILRSDMPTLVARAHHGVLAAAALRVGLQERDPLRVATWCLGSDTTPDSPEVYLAAAYRALALTEWALAEQLSRAAEGVGGGAQATLVRAAALVHLGGWGGANDLLAGLPEGALDDKLLAEYTRFRAAYLVWSQGRAAAGQELLTRTASRLSGSARARVLIESAYTAAFACQSAESLRLARDAMDAAGPALELRVQALAVAALAWTIGGHSTLALRAAETAGPQVADVIARDPYPGNAVMVLLPAQCMALIAQGRIVEAAGLAESALDGAESLRATALSLRGRVALVEGRLAVAESSGLEVLRDTGWGPAAQWPTAIVTAAAAQRGSPETAASFADRPSPGDPQVPLYLHELTVARGWLAAAQGDVAAGLAQIRDAAEVAAGRGAWLLEMLALVDIVRLGAPSSAAARLAALCDLVEGAFVVAAAAYAQAAAAEDGEALDEVSLRYETMGALLLAAESAADASAAHRTAGSRTRDRNSRARALSLAARCEGPRTPALRLGDADPLVTQLTRREREVMELAARGLTNREIAEHLYVSIRTVNAHLNHVYGKLGLNDRTQLSGLVPPPPH